VKRHTAYFDRFTFTLRADTVESCCHQGDCGEDVKVALRTVGVRRVLEKLAPEAIRAELRDCGAWTEKDLADNGANLERILWIGACNIRDKLRAKEREREEKEWEREEKEREREIARLQKLKATDPYFIDPLTGRERTVDIFLTIHGGMKKIGSFSGRASIQIPAARTWARYYAGAHGVTVTACDYANGKNLEVFE
jgi:hypothetical protein